MTFETYQATKSHQGRRCEREAEDRADAIAERRAETWAERGERWQEAVAYGEIR